MGVLDHVYELFVTPATRGRQDECNLRPSERLCISLGVLGEEWCHVVSGGEQRLESLADHRIASQDGNVGRPFGRLQLTHVHPPIIKWQRVPARTLYGLSYICHLAYKPETCYL